MAFFDKIGQTISAGVSSVSDSTKTFAGTAKLNSQINTAKNNIKKTYEDMGKYYYDNRGNASTAELDRMCGEIDKLNDEIHDLELKVKLAKGIVPCSNCGADVSVNSSFCANCGAKVVMPTAAETVPEGKKKCIKCGSIEDADTKFCSQCGTKMPEEVQAVEETKVCPKCGITQPADMKFCANCGAKLEEPKEETAAETAENTEEKPAEAAEEKPAEAAEEKPEAVEEKTEAAEEKPAEATEEAKAEENAAVAAPAEQVTAQPEIKAETADVKMLVCANCGNKEPEGTRFCSECGAQFGAPKAEAVSPADSVVCSKCGNVEPGGTRFCSECGNKL